MLLQKTLWGFSFFSWKRYSSYSYPWWRICCYKFIYTLTLYSQVFLLIFMNFFRWANSLKIPIISIDYRLSPEYFYVIYINFYKINLSLQHSMIVGKFIAGFCLLHTIILVAFFLYFHYFYRFYSKKNIFSRR